MGPLEAVELVDATGAALDVDDEEVAGALDEVVDEPELHPPTIAAITATATPPTRMRERLPFSTCGPYLSPGRDGARH